MEELNSKELENVTGGVDLVYRKTAKKGKKGLAVVEDVDMLDATGYDSNLNLVRPAKQKGPSTLLGERA